MRRLTAVMLVIALLAACGGGSAPAPCAPVRFAPGVEAEWIRARAAIDFAPARPCAHDGSLRVTGAFVDEVPADGGGFLPRINQGVARGGERLFVFSQTRAPIPFRAIPDGTRLLTVTLGAGREPARGFVGTSPSGAAIAYLRWRHDAVTTEVSATLRPVFSERDLEALVRGTAAGS